MPGFQGWNFAHDRDRTAIPEHVLDVTTNIMSYLVETVVGLRDSPVHRVPPDFCGAHIALINQFFLVGYVVVQSGISQTKQVGHVL